MDIDKEMERLTKEAREKSAREQAEQEAELKSASAEAKKAAAALRASGVKVDDDEDDGEGASVGVTILAIIGGLVVIAVAWYFVVAPLLSLAITLGMLALVVWVILKLLGFGAKT